MRPRSPGELGDAYMAACTTQGGGSAGVSAPGRLGWYIRRLARMSPPEVAHRVVEQAKRAADARSRWRWSDFGNFSGALQGLPGAVSSRADALTADVMGEVARVRARSFQLLNRQWPPTQDWDALWHLDPVTGTNWPGADTFAFQADYRHVGGKGDVKFVWEVNRLQFLPVLALANEHDLLAQILESWMASNPPFQGINWTSGIEAASRVISALAAFALLDGGARQRLDSPIRSFLEAHLFWINRYPSLHSSANNHRVAEQVAEFLVTLCATGLPGSRTMFVTGRDGLEERMRHLFHADGVGAEQSVTYATYALEWFALAGIAADGMGASFSTAYKARAAKAADHLLWLMDDAAHTPAIGDGDETRVLALKQEPEVRYAASVAALVARWLEMPELLPPTRDAHIRDLWGAGDIVPVRPARLGPRTFDEGGYTVFRESTPRGTFVCVFDHGPLGFEAIAAHGHADALSLWLSWGNEPIFIDAGTYLYHSGGQWRDHFRGTTVHNTFSIENADQSTIAGPFNWSRHAHVKNIRRSATSITAEHDGYLDAFGVIHSRTLDMGSSPRILVSDTLMGNPRRAALKWEAGFMLAPDMQVEKADGAIMLTTGGGRKLRLAVEQGPAFSHDTQCRYSPTFGRTAETARIIVSGLVPNNSQCVLRLRIEPMIDA